MSRRIFLFAGVVLALLLGGPASGAAQSSPNPDQPDKPSLTAKELETYFEPYVPEVKKCWLTHAKGPDVKGELRLELVIHNHGHVRRFAFMAPGVVGKPLAKLDACLRKLSKKWSFPQRGGFTTAVIPFYYQRTNAPGAGPEGTCRTKRGCPKGTP